MGSADQLSSTPSDADLLSTATGTSGHGAERHRLHSSPDVLFSAQAVSGRPLPTRAGDSSVIGCDDVLIVVLYGTCQPAAHDLARLRWGDVIRLDQPKSTLVEIFLDGCRFAEGKLVGVEGQMGVKITKILARQLAKHAA